ncbi:MAG: RICIN domain-containing protein, partial [Oscillospiraceae bacterium]|nr:RICIN domain-containing protein [Oscillospiraceae bacterium]
YMYFRVTKNPEDISEWHAEQFYFCETNTDMENSTYNATYPTIFFVHDDEGIEGNDVIYAGWRGVHWKPTLAKFPMPDENGRFGTTTDGQLKPVMGQTQVANTSYWDYDNGGRSDSGRRPYTKYDYDVEKNLIYITFTANHPDNDVNNNIYYFTLDINDQNIYTAMGEYLQPLPKENKAEYKSQGAGGTSGQWGVETNRLVGTYPELLVFDANAQLINGGERRGWTWDIAHNDKGEPCIVYADITATPPGENGALPTGYKGATPVEGDIYGRDDSRTYHYYWYARWDSETGEWVNTYLTYAGKWFHQNATQERCYSGGLTFDHNFPGNVIYLAIPTEGKYGNVFEIYRWETDDYGTTWTKREAITQDSPTTNARPNAIYNYKMNEDGTNAGPRLLWISGEYRYWMNYEYKTGVKTDFPGMITQDDPEMFAAVSLTSGGVELEKLPSSGNEEITAKFNISNISIGDGNAKLALAHYGADGSLKGVKAVDEFIPARSVPQTSVIGADKDDSRVNGLSAMGEDEVIVELSYVPESGYAVGDSVKLFAWNMGIERQLNPIMEIPYEISTSGSRYLFSDYFTYEGDDKLVLHEDYNGWTAKSYSGGREFNDTTNYVALTKAPFGNTGLHIFRHGDGGLMVSHALPDTDGKDYTLEFTMRHIDEWSWNNTDNQGFTLSHGVPTGVNDATNSHSAFQYRYGSAWRDENGRGTSGRVRNTLAFDGGSQNEIFHNVDLDRDVSDAERYQRLQYYKDLTHPQVGYYDSQEEVYIHDYNDALYTGSLFRIKVNVHPATEMIEMSVNDGYRTAYYTTFYNSGYDWEANPIDTITFSIGNEKWGEVYIDDFRMYLSGEGTALRNVTITPVSGPAMAIGSGTWNMLPMGDAYVFFDPADSPKVMEVYSQSLVVGGTVGTWEYNGGDNQKFYLEDAGDGNYYIRGKQSGLYLGVSSAGAVSLQTKESATVFTIEETGDQISAAFVQLAEMIEDGTYIPTMDAILEE